MNKIDLNGVEYELLKDCLRRCDDHKQKIPLGYLKDEGDFFTVKFIKGTDNQLAEPMKMYEYGSLEECYIPFDFLNQPEINFS